ncbi:phosphatidylinositol-specific phospholipase C1-like protein [Telluribacter humicola]|uniref:phosphatidylinositol-specific phospholipase C1-like protein n=1 Tax=Telluribacter humicola TaxID=1720261 RepID=UPI001A963BE9|nr:phosphatidylinositol-specific phospholipase C1-like protein [Telluribacter humicola]
MKGIAIILSGILLSGAVAAQGTSTKKEDIAGKVVKEAAHIPLNHIQVIGSHNSYKQAIDPALFQMLKQTSGDMANGIDYSHISIIEQLNMGLGNLEIDIYADAEGGKYAHPKGLDWVNNQAKAYDPEKQMMKPGFKIFHIQEIDFRSHYLTLENCLQDLKQWSDQNPGHQPVFITMNAKDQAIKREGFTVPEKFTSAVLDQLDRVILDKLGKDKLITPDQVRGKYSTLEEAVLQGNWPSLQEAKGKFIFVLDEKDEKRATYIQDHPSLKGRVLFANAEPGTPEAAILIMNDPVKEADRIQKLVKKGYIVRTRADANTTQARTNDRSQYEAALKSGAQIITTDYYQKSTHFVSDYEVSFEGNQYFRLNPFLKK